MAHLAEAKMSKKNFWHWGKNDFCHELGLIPTFVCMDVCPCTSSVLCMILVSPVSCTFFVHLHTRLFPNCLGCLRIFLHQNRVKNRSKHIFPKNARPLGILDEVLLAQFQCISAIFMPPEVPRTRENGPFWDRKWVNDTKNMSTQKRYYTPHPNNVLDPV